MQTHNDKTFRYLPEAAWLKGNTHLHTVASDGILTVDEVAERYTSAGHDFTFITDHMAPSSEWSRGTKHPLAIFDGVEIHGNDDRGGFYHMVCLGTVTGIEKEMPLTEALAACKAQGAMVILAHPAWTGNSFEDAEAHEFEGVEVYNNICRFLIGKGNAEIFWDRMLENNTDIVGIACDDAHFAPQHPVWNGGWVMVQADECTQESVIAALRAGRFYSTRGPEIHSMELSGGALHAKTSPVEMAWIAGDRSHGRRIAAEAGKPLTEITLELPNDFAYMRFQVEDAQGRRAWTNTLFT